MVRRSGRGSLDTPSTDGLGCPHHVDSVVTPTYRFVNPSREEPAQVPLIDLHRELGLE